MQRLVKSINSACGELAIPEKVIDDTFDWWWSCVEKPLDKISALPEESESAAGRSVEEVLHEILALTRAQQKLLSDPAQLIPSSFIEVLLRNATSGIGLDLRADFDVALGGLLNAIADPGAKDVAVCAERVQAVYERMINRRPLATLFSRAIDEQMRLTSGDE
jgi:hypothetical protein